MKPESPTTYQGSESTHSEGHSLRPEKVMGPTSPEVGIEKGAEQFEGRAEHSAVSTDIGASISLPTPVIDDPVVIDDTASVVAGAPLIAADDDLIEKEWVDRAKKIVAETKNDPYKREEQVSKLQGDYLKKRFGRELGAAD